MGIQVFYGISYFCSKLIEGHVTSGFYFFTSAISFLILFSAARFSRRKPPHENVSQFFIPLFLLVGGFVIQQSIWDLSLSYTTATNGSILSSIFPILVLGFVFLIQKERFSGSVSLGFLISFIAVLLMRRMEEFSFFEGTIKGDLMQFLSLLMGAGLIVFAKQFIEKHDFLWIATWFVGVNSLFIALKGQLITGDLFNLSEFSGGDLIAAGVFVILWKTCPLLVISFLALKLIRVYKVSFSLFFVPIITTIYASFSFGQEITVRFLISTLFIAFGTYLVFFVKSRGIKTNISLSN